MICQTAEGEPVFEVTLRKTTSCEVCGRRIGSGQKAFRPMAHTARRWTHLFRGQQLWRRYHPECVTPEPDGR